MRIQAFLWLSVAAVASLAQTNDDNSEPAASRTTQNSTALSTSTALQGLPFSLTNLGSIITLGSVSAPTGSYYSYTRQIYESTLSLSGNHTRSSNQSNTNSLYLVGTLLPNATATRTSGTTGTSSATPSNTQPCNGYPEFCNRKYSNITQVCSHNSAFVIKNNAASNQEISIPGQLNDGIRMIQGQTHYVNGTMMNCHTSCNLLNAGTLEAELTTVREWIDAHPYDIVSILIGNSDYVSVDKYRAPLENSGISEYAYIPPKIPMYRDDWPTLSSMILSGKRAVVFMDYNANQTEIPYILDEFSQMWETPFSPTDPSFPCTQQRPPGITTEQAKERLYLANHNLNVGFSISGSEILIPNYANLTEVNAVNGTAGLGTMARNCRSDWGVPPNFLLVDYYNIGNGSVFEVAAQMNNVTYNGNCCGSDTSISSAMSSKKLSETAVMLALGAAAMLSSILAF